MDPVLTRLGMEQSGIEPMIMLEIQLDTKKHDIIKRSLEPLLNNYRQLIATRTPADDTEAAAMRVIRAIAATIENKQLKDFGKLSGGSGNVARDSRKLQSILVKQFSLLKGIEKTIAEKNPDQIQTLFRELLILASEEERLLQKLRVDERIVIDQLKELRQKIADANHRSGAEFEEYRKAA
ncbi:hypothetical protein HYY74_05050 [Candidatus Woesearchaeota archaeon]|nr:hypothetical protein [Candidatus Woesearchaeota archaeon]